MNRLHRSEGLRYKIKFCRLCKLLDINNNKKKRLSFIIEQVLRGALTTVLTDGQSNL